MAGSQNGTVFRKGEGSYDPPAVASVVALNNLVYALILLVVITMIAWVGGGSCNPSPPSQPPDPNPRPGPPMTTNLRHYTVQVGSFKKREEANSLATTLRSKNINNFIVQADQQWLVCVGQEGRYGSAKGAKRLANRLKAEGIGDPVVLPPKKKE